MDLNEALKQFDRVNANLLKAESLWETLRSLTPDDIRFSSGTEEARNYERTRCSFIEFVTSLPPIDGFGIKAQPLEYNSIAQGRLDANESGEILAQVWIDERIHLPGKELDEYRFIFDRKKRQLVKGRLEELTTAFDIALSDLSPIVKAYEGESLSKEVQWAPLKEITGEIERLLGKEIETGVWIDLRRHIHFAEKHDYFDICAEDWPKFKKYLSLAQQQDSVPLSISVSDLGELVASKPAGPVTTALNWSALDGESFERLVFDIVGDADGYENPKWIMNTNAPDRGRDLSVDRVRTDTLSGVIRERVILQCKHKTTGSVKDTDISDLLTRITHWEPPTIHLVIVVTSSKFTADAVAYIEKHNNSGKNPKIEMWADSDLERILARKPHLAAGHNLR